MQPPPPPGGPVSHVQFTMLRCRSVIITMTERRIDADYAGATGNSDEPGTNLAFCPGAFQGPGMISKVTGQ